MAFTDNCDLYGAVHEDGVHRVLAHIARQRPSLINYATADVASNPKLWCRDVPHTADVTKHGNPLFTIMDPLPLFGADSPPVAIGFCAQLTRAQIDFHEGNSIGLPGELNPPLPPQRVAVALQFCAGLACPSPGIVDRIPVERGGSTASPGTDHRLFFRGGLGASASTSSRLAMSTATSYSAGRSCSAGWTTWTSST